MDRINNKKIKFWLALMRFGARCGCHQMAKRSFFFRGYQFPVCARCTGLFIGEIISVICLAFGFEIGFLWGLALVIPLAFDGGLQYIEVFESNNIRRVITGVVAGFGLTYVYYYAIVFAIEKTAKLFA